MMKCIVLDIRSGNWGFTYRKLRRSETRMAGKTFVRQLRNNRTHAGVSSLTDLEAS